MNINELPEYKKVSSALKSAGFRFNIIGLPDHQMLTVAIKADDEDEAQKRKAEQIMQSLGGKKKHDWSIYGSGFDQAFFDLKAPSWKKAEKEEMIKGMFNSEEPTAHRNSVMSKFKVGDKVKTKSGVLYRVTKADHPVLTGKVLTSKMSDGTPSWWDESDLTLVNAEEPTAANLAAPISAHEATKLLIAKRTKMNQYAKVEPNTLYYRALGAIYAVPDTDVNRAAIEAIGSRVLPLKEGGVVGNGEAVENANTASRNSVVSNALAWKRGVAVNSANILVDAPSGSEVAIRQNNSTVEILGAKGAMKPYVIGFHSMKEAQDFAKSKAWRIIETGRYLHNSDTDAAVNTLTVGQKCQYFDGRSYPGKWVSATVVKASGKKYDVKLADGSIVRDLSDMADNKWGSIKAANSVCNAVTDWEKTYTIKGLPVKLVYRGAPYSDIKATVVGGNLDYVPVARCTMSNPPDQAGAEKLVAPVWSKVKRTAKNTNEVFNAKFKVGDRVETVDSASLKVVANAVAALKNSVACNSDWDPWILAAKKLNISPSKKITLQYVGGGDCDVEMGHKVDIPFSEFVYDHSYGTPRLDNLLGGMWVDDCGRWKIVSGMDDIRKIYMLSEELGIPEKMLTKQSVSIMAIRGRRNALRGSGGHSYGKVECTPEQWNNLLSLGYKTQNVSEDFHADPKAPWSHTDWQNVVLVDDTIFYKKGYKPKTSISHIIAEWD